MPIAQVLINQRASSGSFQSLPMLWKGMQRGPLQSYYVVVMLGVDYVVEVNKRLDDSTHCQENS